MDREGRLVTNAHVVEGAASVIVRSRSQRKDVICVARFDPRYDLVVLETGYQNTSTVSLRDSTQLVISSRVGGVPLRVEKEKWRILPVGEGHDQPTARSGGRR